MKHPSDDHENHPNQDENSLKLRHEKRHLLLSLKEKPMETETTWLKFLDGRKATV